MDLILPAAPTVAVFAITAIVLVAIPRPNMLFPHSLGINIGIKRIAAAGNHGETEATLRATRALFVNRDNLRKALAVVVNETMKARDPLWWGHGTACASDAKKFGSWSSNMMTEYHVRYGGHGVMIY